MRDECEKQATDRPLGYPRQTLRQRLQEQNESMRAQIRRFESEINHNEAALKVLDKNKDLETLVGLLNR